jgi:hypothetical protein
MVLHGVERLVGNAQYRARQPRERLFKLRALARLVAIVRDSLPEVWDRLKKPLVYVNKGVTGDRCARRAVQCGPSAELSRSLLPLPQSYATHFTAKDLKTGRRVVMTILTPQDNVTSLKVRMLPARARPRPRAAARRGAHTYRSLMPPPHSARPPPSWCRARSARTCG